MIKQETIQQIIALARVEEVVGDFVNLNRRGVNMIGLCPFHDEKTPSFTVSPAKNIYKCFGCGKGGDPVRFVMDHEGFSYPEALRYLAEKYNIEVQETQDTAAEKALKLEKDSLFIINEYAKNYFENNLMNTQEGKAIGLSYFKERGFTEATIKKFNLGYAVDDYTDFTDFAKEKQLNTEKVKALGLTSQKGYDFFRARVMFCIHNLSGKVIAFAGRTLSKDKKTPKYINSPETEIYNKRNVLFAMNFAKQPIRKEDECVIVEGYTDVITLHQNGIENVVASSGTSLTEGQIRLVKRYTDNIKIIYDGDAAGIKAALRGMDLVLEQDMNVKLVLLPEGHDPDSYLKEVGTDAFKTYLKENEHDFVIFKINLLLEEAGNDPIQKTVVLRNIVGSIAKIKDPLKRALYIQQCSRLMEVDEQAIISATNKEIREAIRQKKFKDDRDKLIESRREEQLTVVDKTKTGLPKQDIVTTFSRHDAQEKDILRVMLNFSNAIYEEENNTTVLKYIIENTEDFKDEIDNPTYKKMYDSLFETLQKGQQFELNQFINHEDESIRNLAIDMVSTPYVYANWEGKGVLLENQKAPEENHVKDAHQSVLRFLFKKIDRKRDEVKAQIKTLSKEGKSEDVILYLKVLNHLTEQRISIGNELGIVTTGD